MKFDITQRVLLVKFFYELSKICLVQRAFRSQYSKESYSSHKAIKNIVSNIEKYGSVARVPPNKKISDQKREMAENEVH